MKAINNCDIEAGQTDIPISIYSAIDKETSFKQISACCNSAVSYKKTCSTCNKELSQEEIKKALEVGDTLKEVNTDLVKVDNSNLKIIGVVKYFDFENGLIPNGDTWFIGFQFDKKNKGKNLRNIMKFAYFREALRDSNLFFLALINVRGKEHIVLLKPYFKGLIGVGLYNFSLIRDIHEIAGYSENYEVNPETIKQMSETLKIKAEAKIKDIANTREELIEKALTDTTTEAKPLALDNPMELISF